MNHKDYTVLTLAVLIASMPYLLAQTHIGVDTNSTQTLSNKTMAGLTYSGDLTILDVVAESGNFTVNNREHLVTTGGSNVTATLESATGSLKVRDVCKVDTGSGDVVITRAGSDVIYSQGGTSANTRTLENRGDCDTLQDWASGSWIARGNGT